MEVSTSVVPSSAKPLKHLNKIAQRPTLDIDFEDLKYSVKDINDGEWRQILNSVSGKFRYGELTAILGPSGSGKTTLLNILTGYIKNGVQGSIKINDSARDMTVFRKLSSYIMQDNVIQPRLTVKEAIAYAANLKLSGTTKDEELTAVIEEVIDFLGLQTCTDTQSEYLSGGQRKRLTIALELVSNPPVVFLDEPTTGLDDYAVKQCIYLLKKISKLDRTVICTIHQPSSFLFQYFDQVYIIANGVCIYNGSPDKLVPFLSKTGYPCPSNYTPTDYIIELVHLYPSTIEDLKTHTKNGKFNMRESVRTVSQQIIKKISTNDTSSSFLNQFFLLLSRMILQTIRNKAALTIQFIHHIFSAVIVGAIFVGIGNDASRIFEIFKFCLCCNVFFSYTYVMGPVVAFPAEVKLMKREHFNGWYRIRAYYCALTVATLPLFIVLSTLFIFIIYFMTDQPKDIDRFIGFYLINMTLGLTSQGLGYLIGSVFDITRGAIIGPTVIASMLIMGVYGIGNKSSHIALFFKILMNLDFLRNGIIGLCSTLFYERKPLLCKEFYCHYAEPGLVARDHSIPLIHYNYDLARIVIFMVLFRILVFIALKCTLNYEFTSRIIYYGKRIMKIFRII